MDPQHPQEIDLLSYEKVYDDDRVGPATPRPNPKKSRSPPKSPPPKRTKATGKKNPKKENQNQQLKKPENIHNYVIISGIFNTFISSCKFQTKGR